MELNIMQVRAKRQQGKFDLAGALRRALDDAGIMLRDGDVVAVSTKYVSVSQGRMVSLGNIRASGDALDISGRYGIQPGMAEAILRESDGILGGTRGFVLALVDGIMAPNAGIDASNAQPGTIILYPSRPWETARYLRRRLLLDADTKVGVVLVDSRLLPGRVGTTGVAVACAGIRPVLDMRGDRDLEGRPLKVTFQAVADTLASMANYVMGEGSQSVPIAILRGSEAADNTDTPAASLLVEPSECVYMRSMGIGAAGEKAAGTIWPVHKPDAVR